VGLALGGGAARGLAHIGVLQVLTEADIPIDMISGSSAGAIVGALFAAGISPARQQEVVKNLHWNTLSTIGIFDLKSLPTSLLGLPLGLLDLDRLITWLEKIWAGPLNFDQLQLPFAALATDIINDEVVIMNKGSVAEAVRASCSMPGIFTPFRREGRLLVDGGVMVNLPVQVVKQMGADYIIGVDLLPPPEPGDPEPDTLLAMSMTSLTALMRANQAYGSQPDCTISPAVGPYSLMDLTAADALIDVGRAAAEAALPTIRAALHQTAKG
jgi:NTE family protein